MNSTNTTLGVFLNPFKFVLTCLYLVDQSIHLFVVIPFERSFKILMTDGKLIRVVNQTKEKKKTRFLTWFGDQCDPYIYKVF